MGNRWLKRTLVQAALALVPLVLASSVGFRLPIHRVCTVGGSSAVFVYRTAALGVGYVGSAKGRPCHESIYESFRKASMSRSMAPAGMPAQLARVASPVTVLGNRPNRYFKVY